MIETGEIMKIGLERTDLGGIMKIDQEVVTNEGKSMKTGLEVIIGIDQEQAEEKSMIGPRVMIETGEIMKIGLERTDLGGIMKIDQEVVTNEGKSMKTGLEVMIE